MRTRILFGALLATLALRAADRPNIVYIMTDDQGWGDLSVQGHPSIRTPNIDRLAREGARLTDFYAQPFCGPSRAALMTGTYPARNSLAFNHIPRARTGIHPNEITVAEVLKARNYRTALVGKWHLGDAPEFLPTRHGFDSYFGLPYSNDMWPYHPKVIEQPEEDDRMRAARKRARYTGFDGEGQIYPLDWFPPLPLMADEEVVELNPRQELLTQRYTDRAIEILRADDERPVFLYLAYSMPHVPLFRSHEFEGRSLRGVYGDVIEEIDASVGRILAAIQELGIDDETLVVFTSDNGPWIEYGFDAGSAGPLRGSKGGNYEGGLRVPFLARWPGRIPPGLVSSEIAANIDILPTLAEIAGAQTPSDRTLDGRSIWRLLTEPGSKSPRGDFFYFVGGMRYRAEDGPPVNDPRLDAVRDGPWKLHVETAGDDREVTAQALYNLREDVGERLDYSRKEPEIAERLRKKAQSFNDSLRANTRPLGRLRGQRNGNL